MKLFSFILTSLLLVNTLLTAEAPTSWVIGTEYENGSIVTYGKNTYKALKDVPESVGGYPNTLIDYWININKLMPGLDHNTSLAYPKGVKVASGNVYYSSIADYIPVGISITNTNYWEQTNFNFDKDEANTLNIPNASEIIDNNYTLPEDDAKIVNISTRGYVGTGNDILIAGFKLEGDEDATKKCMIGVTAASLQDDPSLGFFTLKDPLLILYKEGVEDYLAINFSWTTLTDEEKAILGDSAPSSDMDPIIIADLGPGTYTAVVMGNQGLTGIATVGVNDLKMDGGIGNIELINISTRGFVKSEPVNWMFAGFIIEGPVGSSLDVMVGNTAASLGDNPENNFFSLKDPLMILYKDGVAEEIDRNDNWGDRPQSEKDTMSINNSTPKDTKESAIIRSLSPGTYNTVMLGLGGVGNAVIGVNVIP